MKIICIDSNLDNITWYIKPDTSLLRNNNSFFYPDFSNNIQCKAGIVLRIDKVGRSILAKAANRYYSEVGFGVQFTAYDLLKSSTFHDLATSFDYSSAISPEFISLDKASDYSFEINKQPVLSGKLTNIAFDKIIEQISKFVTLKIGDFLFIGSIATPVKIGDKLHGYIGDKLLCNFDIK